MHVYTDDVAYANQIVTSSPDWLIFKPPSPGDNARDMVIERLLGEEKVMHCTLSSFRNYSLVLLAGHALRSQFDLIHELISEGKELPDGLVCLAGYGEDFKGFHERSWTAIPGNLHMTVLFKPGKPVFRAESGMLALGPVSVVEAIGKVKTLSAGVGIKWVNDVVISGAKVAGVLTRSQIAGKILTHIALGIGINIGKSPQLPPDPFVPSVVHLNQFGKCSMRELFWNLLDSMAENYHLLVSGMGRLVVEKYIGFSEIIGREIVIFSDVPGQSPQELRRGKVTGIGEQLEIYLEGYSKAVRRGRLAYTNDLA